MPAKVKPIPEGFHTLTPHLICRDANRALEFYKQAFGAEELARMPGPDGKTVMHAELKIGDSVLMICDEFPDMNCRSPQAIGGTPVTLHLYVNNADTAYDRAVKAGATAVMPPADMFWGDRFGKVKDPFGHEWSIATHKEEVSPEECVKRAQKFCSKQ